MKVADTQNLEKLCGHYSTHQMFNTWNPKTKKLDVLNNNT